MNKYIVLFLLAILQLSIFSETIKGNVYTSDQIPVADCTVVIPEFDIIEYTIDDGSFFIDSDIQFTPETKMLFIAPGFVELTTTLDDLRSDNSFVILESEIIEMEEITVIAESDNAATPSVNFSKKDIEKTSTGNDPVQIIAVNSGVLTGTEVLPHSYTSEPFEIGGGLHGNLPLPEFIVRGTPPEGNVYKYNNISLPTLYHSRGYPLPRSIIPTALVNNVEILNGGYGVESGPAVGGLFYFQPPSVIPEESYFKVDTSLVNGNFYTEQRFSENLGLYLSIRKSLYDFTYQPLDYLKTVLTMDTQFTDYSHYGDADYLARLLYQINSNNLVSLDIMGLYDFYSDEPIDDVPGHSDRVRGYEEWYSNFFTNAIGFTWDYYSGKVDNRLYLNIGYSNFNSDELWYNWKEELNDFKFALYCNFFNDLKTTTLGDVYNLDLSEKLNFELGGEFNLSDLESSYLRGNNDYLGVNTVFTDNKVDKLTYDAYGYGNLEYKSDDFTFNGGYRLDYFKLNNQFRSTFNGSVGYTGFSTSAITLSGGHYSGKLNYLSLLKNIDFTDFDPDKELVIPKMESLNIIVNSNISKNLTLKVNGYINYLYSLDQNNALLLSDVSSLGEIISGLLMGLEFNFDWVASDKFQLKSSYTLSSSKYNVEKLGWVRANSDYTNVFVFISSFNPIDKLSFGANLKTLIGQPFTPYKIIGFDENGYSIREYYDFNSGNNLIPCFNLDLSIKYNTKWFGKDTKLYIDITNVINGPMEIDSPYEDYIGKDTSNFSERDYLFSSFMDIEESNIVLDFGISMVF